MALVKILSIDGGGIRGIIPGRLIAEIENRTGKRAYELFDLIAGNSTGGIITLGLTIPRLDPKDPTRFMPMSGTELVSMYRKDGPNIFRRPKRINPMGIFAPKFKAESIEAILNKYFEHYEIKDALTSILVPSYDIERRKTVFFKRRTALERPNLNNFYVRDVARATSAAPTFFPPVGIHSLGSPNERSTHYLVDGGVVANNPALCAIAETNVDKALGGNSHEALKGKGDGHNLLLASIGTGSSTRSLSYKSARGWGLGGWSGSIVDVVFDGTAQAVEYQAECSVPNLKDEQRYFRLQRNLDIASDDIDQVDSENLAKLMNEADQLIRDRDDEIQTLCDLLMRDYDEKQAAMAGMAALKNPLPGQLLDENQPQLV